LPLYIGTRLKTAGTVYRLFYCESDLN
jgi:hypothetical protein